MCDIELVALDLHVLVANRLVQCATYLCFLLRMLIRLMKCLVVQVTAIVALYRDASCCVDADDAITGVFHCQWGFPRRFVD